MIRLFTSAKEDEPLLDTSATPNWPERFVQLATESKDKRLKQFYEASCVAGDTH